MTLCPRCQLQALYNLPASQPSPQQSAWWAEAWLGDLQTRLHPSLADLTHCGSQPDGLSPAAAAVACMHPVVEQVMADLAGTPGMEAVLACTEGASFGRIATHMELGVPVSQNEVGGAAETSWLWSPEPLKKMGREGVHVSPGEMSLQCCSIRSSPLGRTCQGLQVRCLRPLLHCRRRQDLKHRGFRYASI